MEDQTISTSRKPDGSLSTVTPLRASVASPITGYLSKLLENRAAATAPAPRNPTPRFSEEIPTMAQRPGYVPQMGAAPVQSRSLQMPQPIARYSYGVQGMNNAWAGTAARLPTFIGSGQVGKDFLVDS